MADWEGIAGGTLLVPSGSSNHLFIILIKSSDFEGYIPNQCISVNVTSIHDGVNHDETCILQAGCHPFITHDSYVIYSRARIDSEKHLKGQVDSGRMIPKEPIDEALLEEIIQGLKDSIFTKKYLKQLVN